MKALFKHREMITVIGIIAFVAIVTIVHPSFIAPSNLARIANSTVILALLAIGGTVVIITKNIDVSVGSTLALSGVIGGLMMSNGIPIWIVLISVVLVGAVLGAINGIGVTYGHVPSIVMTLATLAAYRGISFLITGGHSVESIPTEYRRLGRVEFLGLPLMVWFVIAILIIMSLILWKTPFGRQLYATGDNADGAKLIGIRTELTIILAFTISGMLTAIAALVFIAQVGSIGNQAGQGIEMRAIASAVIGGASLTGGVGTAVGAVLGAIFISTATSSLSFLGVPGSWADTVIGAILLIALFADARVRALLSARRLAERYRRQDPQAKISEVKR
ncbi:MAG: ABC transporter permease [Canibacter sp.]